MLKEPSQREVEAEGTRWGRGCFVREVTSEAGERRDPETGAPHLWQLGLKATNAKVGSFLVLSTASL